MKANDLALVYATLSNCHERLAEHYSDLARSEESPRTEPPWMSFARGELGQSEIVGDDHNPRIVAYHAVTAAGAAPDEVPWCASFVCWALEQAGIPHPRSKRARSFLDWGTEITPPRPGCVVVLKRGEAPKGHVGFWVRRDRILGGNQGNTVSIKPYRPGDVLGYFWPSDASGVWPTGE